MTNNFQKPSAFVVLFALTASATALFGGIPEAQAMKCAAGYVHRVNPNGVETCAAVVGNLFHVYDNRGNSLISPARLE